MKNRFHQFLCYACLLLLVQSCGGKYNFEVNGQKPVYISYNDLYQYQQVVPQPIENSGKVLLYGSYLFMVEVNKGVHVIDIIDTVNPKKISFLHIPGNKDIAAQNDLLYADNGPDLIVLDIKNINDIKLVTRQKNIFMPSEFYPSGYIGFFECADYSKGWVTGWEPATLANPECRRE